jgi:hypothetical protein
VGTIVAVVDVVVGQGRLLMEAEAAALSPICA